MVASAAVIVMDTPLCCCSNSLFLMKDDGWLSGPQKGGSFLGFIETVNARAKLTQAKRALFIRRRHFFRRDWVHVSLSPQHHHSLNDLRSGSEKDRHRHFTSGKRDGHDEGRSQASCPPGGISHHCDLRDCPRNLLVGKKESVASSSSSGLERLARRLLPLVDERRENSLFWSTNGFILFYI